MKRIRTILAVSLVLIMVMSVCPASTNTAAAEVQIANIFVERTDNEVLETVKGVIEIDGSGLKDAMVRVRTTAGGGTKILGVDLGMQTTNEDVYLKFELTGAEMKSVLLSDGINVGGKLIPVDDANFATINSVEPKVVYLGGEALFIHGSNLDRTTDMITFGNGSLNGTIARTASTITVSNLFGDTGFHDIIFTRVNTGVTNLQTGGTVTMRRLYQNQFRVVQEMNIPGLEMYPNKGVPKKTTVFLRAENLDKCSVFFVRNLSDPLYASNMGTNYEYIPSASGDDIIKVKVPDVTPGTYKVVLTNFITNPASGTDLRNLVTKQQYVGDFLIISASDAAEIVSISPSQGPNLSNNPVTIVGYNFEELIIDGLSAASGTSPTITRSLDNKSMEFDYGNGTYDLGTESKNVHVTRTMTVIIGMDAEFQEVSQQSFINKQYDTVRILTQPIPNSEIEDDASKDVIIELVTLLEVEGTGQVYEFREIATREDGYLYIKSYTEPVINEVTPRNIQVVQTAGTYVTKEDLVLSITGDNFMVTKYSDPTLGKEYFYYPIVDLGGSICLKREGKDNSVVYVRNLNPVNSPEDDWVELPGASMEVLESSTIMDGSAGKELGSRIVLRIPAGVEVLADRLNFSTYVEVTNPKKNSSEYGYPIRKDDAVQFVVASEAKTPVITSVDPNVVSTEGEKGVEIVGYNFQADVKVYLDGQEIKGIKRDPSSQLITFDAPVGREGETRLVVMNPEGGSDTTSFIYVKTQTNPKLTSISPDEGTIGTLVLVNGDVFLEPDPTAALGGIGIYRLIGTRVFFDNRDVNDYRYRAGTTTIEPQGYLAPYGQELLRVENDNLVMADYYPSVLLQDDTGKFYILKKNASGDALLTDGVYEWVFSNIDSSIVATDQTGAMYSVSLGSSTDCDQLTLNRNTASLTLDVLTPYAVNRQGVITGHRAWVIDGGRRILVSVPDLQVQGVYDVTIMNPDTKKAAIQDGFTFYRSPQRIPVITAIKPDHGSTSGGYFIEIQGSNFEDTGLIKTRVFINSIEVPSTDTIINPECTVIRVKVPAYPGDLRKELGVDHKSVPVVVLNPSDGGSIGLPYGFTYTVPTSQPVIDNLTRKEGSAAGGEYVQIIGRDFRFYEPFEDSNGNFSYDEGIDSFNDVNGNDQWDDLRAYSSIGEIPKDQRADMVSILPQVYFGNNLAQVMDFGSNFIGVQTPRSTAGVASVYVVNNDFGLSNSKPFTFKASSPKITAIVPDTGRKQGGESVEIHGSGLAAGSVQVGQVDGSVEESNMPLVRFGTLTAYGDIVGGRVPNLEVEGYLQVNFDANQDTLTLTLTPSANQVYRQTFVYDGSERYFDLGQLEDIKGIAYSGIEMIRVQVVQDPGNRLRVERGYAPSASLISSSQITVTSPSYHTIGQVAVTVNNPDGATASGKFIYRNPDSKPVITDITRDGKEPVLTEVEGQQVKVLRVNYTSASEICVFGQDFREKAVIKLGNLFTVQPDQITYTLPDKLVFTMPNIAESEIGKLQRLVVVNEDGGIASSDKPSSGLDADKIYIQFTKGETLPAIDSVAPVIGPAIGGTRIKITGSDFRASLEGYEDEELVVYLGGAAATQIEVADYKTIWATTPANTPGSTTVRIENPDGEISNPTGSFTYISVPAVTAIVDPADSTESKPIEQLSVEGGQEIKIKGSGFISGARVVFAPQMEKASSVNGSNIIYRVGSIQEGSYTSRIMDPYTLISGNNGLNVKFIDQNTLTVTTPVGKLDTTGLIVVNPDQGASEPYENISFQLPELAAPSGKVYAEMIHDEYNDVDRAIRVVWNGVSGASQYEIAMVEDDEYYFIGSTSLTTYIFEDIEPNTRYRFIVTAVGNFGSSPPSAESNTVRTGSKTGRPDEDGSLGEKTELNLNGTVANINIGSRDYSIKTLLVDLTRGSLAGAREVVITIPASVIANSTSAGIQIIGPDFTLQFNPQVFKNARVIQNSSRKDAGIRFRMAPLQGTPPASGGNQLSTIYQLESTFYVGQEQAAVDTLTGTMNITMDYDAAKAQLRRYQEVAVHRYNPASGTWVTAPVITQQSSALTQMGIYTVMGIRR